MTMISWLVLATVIQAQDAVFGAQASIVGDMLYITGGWPWMVGQKLQDQAFDLIKYRWVNLSYVGNTSVIRQRHYHSTAVYEDKLIVFGGLKGSTLLSDMYEINTVDMSFKQINSSLPSMAGHRMIKLRDGIYSVHSPAVHWLVKLPDYEFTQVTSQQSAQTFASISDGQGTLYLLDDKLKVYHLDNDTWTSYSHNLPSVSNLYMEYFDGQLLVLGNGFRSKFNISNRTWATTTSIDQPHSACMASYNDQYGFQMLQYGGQVQSQTTSKLTVYDRDLNIQTFGIKSLTEQLVTGFWLRDVQVMYQSLENPLVSTSGIQLEYQVLVLSQDDEHIEFELPTKPNGFYRLKFAKDGYELSKSMFGCQADGYSLIQSQCLAVTTTTATTTSTTSTPTTSTTLTSTLATTSSKDLHTTNPTGLPVITISTSQILKTSSGSEQITSAVIPVDFIPTESSSLNLQENITFYLVVISVVVVILAIIAVGLYLTLRQRFRPGQDKQEKV